MTFTEQLVWAMTFVLEHDKDTEGRMVAKRDDRLLMYAQRAADIISDLRRARNVSETENLNGRIDTVAVLMLRQMTNR